MGSRLVSQVPYLMSTAALPDEARPAASPLAIEQLAPRAGEEGFRHIVEGAKQAILVRDGERLLYATPAYARMLGFDSVEALTQAGRNFADYLHPGERR